MCDCKFVHLRKNFVGMSRAIKFLLKKISPKNKDIHKHLNENILHMGLVVGSVHQIICNFQKCSNLEFIFMS